ncbi:MAG: methionyl-tRNA formyltransferase [Spirochaetaceae bacterium]|nr:methionyl-tRNA formyltransferase [Spirochaetaceae bacterium]
MRIVFAGTPEIAVPTLQSLAQHFNVVAVLCNPDALVGRKRVLTPPAVKVAAEQLNLPVLQPAKLDANLEEQIKTLNADFFICFAYGKIFKESFLNIFKFALNVHPSLLPKYRGPTPIPAAILHGDNETGITIQKLGLKIDSGDIIVQQKFALTGNETTLSLSEQVSRLAPPLVTEAIGALSKNPAAGTAQAADAASYCFMLKKEDGLVLFKKETARQIERKLRAFNPQPPLYTNYKGKELYFYEIRVDDRNLTETGRIAYCNKKDGLGIQTKAGIVAILKLQLAGKKPLEIAAFLNGESDIANANFL